MPSRLFQWESARKSLATFGTAEAELRGYVEAMFLGDSVSSVLDRIEDSPWGKGQGRRVIYGDNAAGIEIVTQPDGKWRRRHLRLRRASCKSE